MEVNKAKEYIENSFLKELIDNPNITDISYNGEYIYYQDNLKGRMRSSIEISEKEVFDFLRQLANLSDSQFSYVDPILDISVDRYRINATHYAFSRKKRRKTINFSIRIGFDSLRIHDDGKFIPKKCLELINLYITNQFSIVIGGLTSSGKTELQKYLLSKFKESSRVIVIDNVDELDSDFINQNIDLQTWLNLDNNKKITFDILIKNALRNNPDYLVVSEARGEEMLPILNGAMSGHPTITTIHAKDIYSMYNRMSRMCMLANQALKFEETLIDIYDHFKLIIHVKKEVVEGNKIIRYVDSIATNRFNKIKLLYKYPNKFFSLPKQLKYDCALDDETFNRITKKRTTPDED